MSRDPFLDDADWPGRDIRPSGGDEAGEPDEESGGELAPTDLIPEEHRESVAQELEDARSEVDKLEEKSRKALDEELNVPTEDLPQTAEAVELLAGTHPSFGHTRPAVPDEDKLDDDSVSGAVFDRAYKTLEHADRSALGFDMQEMAFSESPGEARPFDSIDSPATAAGERDPRDSDAEKQGPEQISQERVQTEKKSIWKRVFEAVVPFLFRLIATIFNGIGQQAESVLSFSVLGVTVGIGKFIAAPFYWIRDLFRRLAERFMDRAMGRSVDRQEPRGPGPPGGRSTAESGEGVEETLGDGPGEKFGEYTSYDPSYRGNTGRRFLEAAQQVLRSAQQQVQRGGNRRLARAMSRYESARELSRVLDAHDAMADAWGADRPSPVDIEAPADSDPGEVRDEIREQLPFDCN